MNELETRDLEDSDSGERHPSIYTSVDGEAIELAEHTEQELDNIEYRPGLPVEDHESMHLKREDKGLHRHSHMDKPALGRPSTGDKQKQDSRKLKNTVDSYKGWLRLLILSYQIGHFLYIYFVIAPHFKTDFGCWLTRFVCGIVFGLTSISHLQVSLNSSLSFKRRKQQEFLQSGDYKACEKCNNIWKPHRTHHCSI